jgi:hypothetical protein
MMQEQELADDGSLLYPEGQLPLVRPVNYTGDAGLYPGYLEPEPYSTAESPVPNQSTGAPIPSDAHYGAAPREKQLEVADADGAPPQTYATTGSAPEHPESAPPLPPVVAGPAPAPYEPPELTPAGPRDARPFTPVDVSRFSPPTASPEAAPPRIETVPQTEEIAATPPAPPRDTTPSVPWEEPTPPPIELPTPAPASTPEPAPPPVDTSRFNPPAEPQYQEEVAMPPATTEITPEENLIDQAVLPAVNRDAQLAQANQALVAAAPGRVTDAGVIAPNTSERLARLRSAQDAYINRLSTTPNRFELAKSKFDTFAQETQPEYDLTRKKALSDAAAFGYTGSGRLVTRYGDIDLTRERDLDAQRSRVFNEALDQSTQDERENARLLAELEANEFGFGNVERDELRGERDWLTDQVDLGLVTDAQSRAELRNERAYQRRLAEQALAGRIGQYEAEEDSYGDEFGRSMERAEFGYDGDPGGVYGQAANRYGRSAELTEEEIAELLRMAALRRQQGQAAGAGAP